MSIILDALKKAETERHLGHLPGLHSRQSASTEPGAATRNRTVVALGFGGAAIVLIGAVAGWVYWNGATPVQQVSLSPQKTTNVQVIEPVSIAVPQQEIPVPPPLLALPATVKPVPMVIAKAAPTAPLPAPPSSNKPAIAVLAQDKVVALADLPPALQRELPALVIGGSMYSDNAADRMLLIDKRLLHEGEEAGSGVVLEKILQKEAILRFRGTRFRINF